MVWCRLMGVCTMMNSWSWVWWCGHRLRGRGCGWGIATWGTAPKGVTAPVQYGPRITAVVVYLYVGQFLSKKRTAQALAELLGIPVSEGTVAAMTQRGADGL